MKKVELKVIEARAHLARAVERMRREDTRQKIVCGALALEFISNHRDRLASAFLSFVDTKKIREGDKQLIDELKRELASKPVETEQARPTPAPTGAPSDQQNQSV